MVNCFRDVVVVCDKTYFEIFFPECGKASEAQRKICRLFKRPSLALGSP